MNRITLVVLASAALACTAGAGASSQAVGALDEAWLQMSIEGSRFEIIAGNLAQRRGKSASVRSLGTLVARDHTKSLREAATLAKSLGVKVPTTPSPTQRWQIAQLK